MNPITQQARSRTFEQTLVSARRTMLMSEILKMAMDSFRASKTRFMLTALGMVIGTASVILVVTIGMTGKQYILDLMQKIGTNSGRAGIRGRWRLARGARALQRLPDPRRRDELSTSRCLASCILRPVLEMHNRLSFPGGTEKDTTVLGVSPHYQHVRNLIVDGRPFL